MHKYYLIFIFVSSFVMSIGHLEAKELSYPESNFSIKIPDTWGEFTKDEVSEVNKLLSEISKGEKFYPITIGFKPINPNESGFPYLLVEEHKLDSSPYNFYKKTLENGMEFSSAEVDKVYDNKFFQENIKNFGMSNPLISKKDGIILLSFGFDLSGQSQKGLLAAFVGNKNVLLFKFYTDNDSYNKDILTFQEIIRSFRFIKDGVDGTQEKGESQESPLNEVELKEVKNDNFVVYPLQKEGNAPYFIYFILYVVVLLGIGFMIKKNFIFLKKSGILYIYLSSAILVLLIPIVISFIFIDLGINSKYFIKRDFNNAFELRATGDCKSFLEYIFVDQSKWKERCEDEKTRKERTQPLVDYKVQRISNKLFSDSAFIQVQLTRATNNNKDNTYSVTYEMKKDGFKWKINQEIK